MIIKMIKWKKIYLQGKYIYVLFCFVLFFLRCNNSNNQLIAIDTYRWWWEINYLTLNRVINNNNNSNIIIIIGMKKIRDQFLINGSLFLLFSFRFFDRSSFYYRSIECCWFTNRSINVIIIWMNIFTIITRTGLLIYNYK